MSGPGVGFEYPAKKVSWLKRDVLIFANSIGATADELHFLYEFHPDFAVFPTYPVVLPFKGDSQEVVDYYASSKAVQIPGVPKLDYKRVVDGERKIQFLKPLPTTSEGRNFEIRQKVNGVYDKGRPGTVVETQFNLVDADSNEVYVVLNGSAFFVGQGNWHGPKGPATESFPPPKDRKPDAVLSHSASNEAALLYRLNGDYNPLHATPEPGQKMGFGGAIMHGLWSWNTSAHEILKALCGSNPANMKEYQARFASPVMPGDTLETSVWRLGVKKNGFEEIRFVTAVKGGKVCLSNGRALVKIDYGAQNKL